METLHSCSSQSGASLISIEASGYGAKTLAGCRVADIVGRIFWYVFLSLFKDCNMANVAHRSVELVWHAKYACVIEKFCRDTGSAATEDLSSE